MDSSEFIIHFLNCFMAYPGLAAHRLEEGAAPVTGSEKREYLNKTGCHCIDSHSRGV